MRRIVLFAVAVTLAAGVGSGSSAVMAPNPGLTGKALRGPTAPVCRVDAPCYAPFKGTLVFTRVTTGELPVRARTDSDGDYRVLLDPARYRVTTGARTRLGNVVKPAIVTVAKGTMRRVNFIVDSGIR